jgi:hypothetical protein
MFLPAELEAGRDGYNPFVIICTWEHDADETAGRKLREIFALFKKPGRSLEGIDIESIRSYNLIGARTFLLIGRTRSNKGLQSLVARISVGNPMDVDLYHAISVHELADIMAELPKNPA